MSSGIRATFRIARRDALRHKGRSALIIAMIAIPVMGLGAADVLARTVQLSNDEKISQTIGQSDVAVQLVGRKVPLYQMALSGYVLHSRLSSATPAYRALESKVLTQVGAVGAPAEVIQSDGDVIANGRRVPVRANSISFGNPLANGIASLSSGHVPTTADELAIQPDLAGRLGVHVGDRITIDTGQDSRQFTVSGLMRDNAEYDDEAVFALPSAQLTSREPMLLLHTESAVTLPQLTELRNEGVASVSRYYVDNPPPIIAQELHQHYYTPDRVGVATVAVGLAILEVILLAGAAFAVGTRRQRRDLAVLAAAGGSTTNVVSVVLAGGVVLGLIAGLVGLGAGVGLAHYLVGTVANRVNHAPGHFDLRPIELLGVFLLGLLTSVIACVLPARLAARENVVAALTGRRGVVRTNYRVPLAGLVMIVIGAIVAAQSAVHFHFRLILAGASLTELGFVACAPTVVGWAGRLAHRLPLAPRLALRDASRNRGRSGPAVAAVMAAIAGSVAVSTYFVSVVHRDRAEYIPEARVGQVVVETYGGAHSGPRLAAVETTVRRDLAPSSLAVVPTVNCIKNGPHCHYFNLTSDAVRFTESGVAVGGPTLLRTLIGRTDPAAEAALASGKVIGFGSMPPSYFDLGHVAPPKAGLVAVPVGSAGASFTGIVSPATAKEYFGNRHSVSSFLLATTTTGKPISQSLEDGLNDELTGNADLTVGRPYSAGGYSGGLIALAIMAGIVTIAATAVSVGLSMVESKPDLMTLSAVGGRPLTRRLLVGSQAGTVAILGALLGVVAGLVPAWAVLRANHDIPFTMPWSTMAVLVIGIPLLAMLATAAFAGTRISLDRRLT